MQLQPKLQFQRSSSMKNSFSILVMCLLSAIACKAQQIFAAKKTSAATATQKTRPSAGPTEKILPYPIIQNKLANGLNVVTVPYSSPGLAAFYIVVRAGSRDEVEPGKTGFAHFF